MNYWILRGQIITAYHQIDTPVWELDDYLNFFNYFMKKFHQKRGIDHYCIPTRKIITIMEQLPYFDDELGNTVDLEMEDYYLLIDSYFKTRMECDYSLFHFMSGNIRLYRYYETCY